MATLAYQFRSTSLATATAIILHIPTLGDFPSPHVFAPAAFYEAEPLADIGQVISNAFVPAAYSHIPPEVLFSNLTDIALRLISQSKPLDPDFAEVVEKEFWNILQ